MTNIKLSASQDSVIDYFKTFLESDSQVFMLKGAAGTGKTTLVTEFIKILEEQKREYGLMAPTGRAAYIIGSKTGKPAFTIHRSIYGLSKLKSTSQNKEDEDDGGIHLRFGLKVNNDSLNAVYIVDESSMVSDKFSENEAFSFGSGCLLTDLFEFARGHKIVLVGDYAQLPPVGMNFSPALDKNYIETKFSCKVTEFMLREVLRQSEGSVMLSNASKIRDAVERKSFIEFSLDNGDDSIAEKIDLLTPYYLLSENKPSVKAAVIAYSNKQVLDYNLAIRRHYYGDTAPRLKAGDLLLICRNNYSYEYELFNGNIIQVKDCQPDSEVKTRYIRVKLGKNRVEQVELRFRRATICFGVRGERVSLNVMLLDNFLDDPNASIGGLLARALIVDFNNRLPQNIKSKESEIRRHLRSKEKLTIEQQELCDAYINLLNKDPYYNAVICKYGYAMTCHKAQGGEWENVFVDMCRFGGTANEDYFRWAYTALTRASKRVWHFRSPDFNYISNLVVEEIKPSANIKISNYSADGNFCDLRFERLTKLAMQNGLSVSEDRSKPYQHIITFTDKDGAVVKFQLWYRAKGYSAKDVLLFSSSEEFTALCSPLIDASYAPDTVPFSAPNRPFAEKLVNFVKSQIEEVGIQLLDITQQNYQDVFHLKTDGIAQIGLNYTAKGNYTYMRLTSSLGTLDTKLQTLRERFI
ncbi:MAG: AAA family ATPase [Paramuribaculum sp.]|nr:AAA family ATPase [Paramuribaculum sp.]MDE5835960.1 AAA family ATPase [Paramuribaculum sp.]